MLTKRSILILCICILFMASAGACVPLRPAATGQWVGPDDAELAEDNLELITHIEGAGLSIAVQGDYAYWGLSHELVILDIRDPAAPVRVASLPTQPTTSYSTVRTRIWWAAAVCALWIFNSPARPSRSALWPLTARLQH